MATKSKTSMARMKKDVKETVIDAAKAAALAAAATAVAKVAEKISGSKAGIDASYELFAVCFHRGSSTHGHYTMCGEAMGHWFYIDDEVSKQMHDINHVIQRDAYILLYKRL